MIKKLILSILLMMFLMSNVYSFSLELVDTDPAPIVAGEYADITLRFINNNIDDNIEDASLKIENTEYITSFSGTEEISLVQTGEQVTRTFRVFFSEEIPQGFVDLSVKGIIDGNQPINTKLRVFVQEATSNPELFIGEIRTTPDELLPDTDNNKMVLSLQNLGDKDAELVTATIEVDNSLIKPSFTYSLTDSVSSVPSGEEVELEFTIDVNENIIQEVPAKLKLRYRAEKSIGNSFDTYEKIIDFNIPITDAPYLVVETVEQLDPFSIGSTENRIRVTIKNDGIEKAEDVRVRLVPDISYPFSFERVVQYVTSEIVSGESAVIEFKTEVLSDAQVRDYPITVVLESLVEESRYSREDSISVSVSKSNKQSTSSIATLLLILIAVVSIIIGVYTFMSRKKKK